jgi:hypothetical protein
MIPSVLAALGAVLTLLAIYFSEAATARRFAAPLLALIVGVGAFATANREGGSGDLMNVVALARAADGASVATTVTLQRPDGGRTVRRVELSRSLPAVAPTLAGLIALATVLGVIGLSGRRADTYARLGAAALAGLAGVAGAVLSAGGTGTGESEVRARLGELVLRGLGAPASFTVPEGTWHYVAGEALPLFALAAALALLAFLPARPLSIAPRLVAAGAALCAVAPVVDIVLTGGFAWRPATAALWVIGLLAAGAAFEPVPSRAATLAGAGAGLALTLL